MTHGSLFSGIGGFDLGAERAGLKNLWACEIDEFKQAILRKHFPDTHIYSDVTTLNLPYVDVISRRKEHQDKERVYSVDEIVAAEHKCIKGKDKLLLRPMLNFSESEVWEVIYANNLPINPCYETANRVGCIFCPFAPKKQILEYCKKYPRAKAKIIDSIQQYQTKMQKCKLSPDEYFDWWLTKKSVKQYIEDKRQTKIEF